MLENGFIKLYRSLLKWEWYDDINTKTVFLHLLLTVSIEDSKWHGIEVKRGSRVSSYAKLAEETNLSIRQLRTAINHLESTGELTRYKYTKYTVFAINNYDDYQQVTNNVASNRQGRDKVATSNRQQYKKEKEDKESKEYLSFCTAEPEKLSTSPTLEDVQNYAEESGISVDAARFFEYYQQRGWRTKNGDAITDWKRTMQFWESREGKGNRMKVKQEIPKSENADAYKGFIYNMEDEVST